MRYKINTKEELESFICQSWDLVNSWIDENQSKLPQPFTSSVDVRESKFKFAPVDQNMYPAGFNNLCNKDLLNASEIIKTSINKISPGVKTIGILPESHTKNKFYLDHLFSLKKTVEFAGFSVIFLSPDDSLFEDKIQLILESFSGHEIKIHKAYFEYDHFKFSSSEIPSPEVIILNNDQSSPFDIEWKNIKIPVIPSPFVGWYRRQKILHFKHYELVANEFCHHFEINPDLIQAKFSYTDNIDFGSKEGIETLATKVDDLLSTLPKDSSVFVKASQGTYGMGISVFRSGEEVISMNRKTRNKMDIGKNNLKFTSVLIQEGVETIVEYDKAPAEITIYLIDGKSIGGFMRANPLKSTQANLNSQGMIYRKFCISEIKQNNDHQIKEQVYTIIARLSTLAASREMKELTENL